MCVTGRIMTCSRKLFNAQLEYRKVLYKYQFTMHKCTGKLRCPSFPTALEQSLHSQSLKRGFLKERKVSR